MATLKRIVNIERMQSSSNKVNKHITLIMLQFFSGSQLKIGKCYTMNKKELKITKISLTKLRFNIL